MVSSQLALDFLKCSNFSSLLKTPLWQVIISLAQWVGPPTREPFQETTLKPVLDSPKRPKKLYRGKSLKCPSFLAILVFNIEAEVFFEARRYYCSTASCQARLTHPLCATLKSPKPQIPPFGEHGLAETNPPKSLSHLRINSRRGRSPSFRGR